MYDAINKFINVFDKLSIIIDDKSINVDVLNETFSKIIQNLTKRWFDNQRENWKKITTWNLIHWLVIYVKFISKFH